MTTLVAKRQLANQGEELTFGSHTTPQPVADGSRDIRHLVQGEREDLSYQIQLDAKEGDGRGGPFQFVQCYRNAQPVADGQGPLD